MIILANLELLEILYTVNLVLVYTLVKFVHHTLFKVVDLKYHVLVHTDHFSSL